MSFFLHSLLQRKFVSIAWTNVRLNELFMTEYCVPLYELLLIPNNYLEISTVRIGQVIRYQIIRV